MSDLTDYIEFEEGSIPLIISVPHGGILECETIPQRSAGVFGIDRGTIEFSKELIELISLKFKKEFSELKTPSYIISKVQRSKIDLNRNESEAYNQNSSLAREIYRFYHRKIQKLVNYNINTFGRSLLLDIHGFEKDNRPTGFRDVEIILGTNNLESLFSISIPKRNWNNNLRGKIIEKFLELEISIAPGHPRRREYVLSGGYITKQYGASQFSSSSKTIQFEFSDRIRKYDKGLREIVLNTLAEIIYEDIVNV